MILVSYDGLVGSVFKKMRVFYMTTVEEQKNILEQKKNRLILQEARLKNKERKMRTRRLIEIGGLAVKADIDYLPNNTLYGAFLSLANQLKKEGAELKNAWTKIGADAFEQENKERIAVVVKFEVEPTLEIRQSIRSYGLKYNRIRKEWYGYIEDLQTLKAQIMNLKYEIEFMD